MRYTTQNKLFSLDFKEDYSQFFNVKGYNWIDFDFLKLYIEADRVHGCFEIEVGLLGLGVRLYWTYHEPALKKALKKYNKRGQGESIRIDFRNNYYRTRRCTVCNKRNTTKLTGKKYVCEDCSK